MLPTRRKTREAALKENMNVVREVVHPQRRSRTVLEEVTQPSRQHARRLMDSDDESECPVVKKTRDQEVAPTRRSKRTLRHPNYADDTTISPPPHKAVGQRGKLKDLDAEGKDQHIKLEDKQDEIEEKVRDQVFGSSEYELMIQRNIAEKRKFLDSLDIFKTKEDLGSYFPKPVQKRAFIHRSPEVRRMSLRQQNLTPDGVDLPPPTERQVTYAEKLHGDHPRPPPGPGPVTEYCRDQDRDAWEGLLQEVHGAVAKGAGGHSAWAGSVESVVKKMRKMVVREEWVMKAVPSRTLAIQLHPSMAKTIVLVGAKWGELGVWDMERKDETSGAHFFNPHSHPINCLTVDPSCPNHIYTTSYDGSVRRTDLEACIVQQVYSYLPENVHNQWVLWHTHVDQHILLVAASHGKIVQVDLREGNTNHPRVFRAHYGKNVKVVTQHPVNTHYFASAARDGVCLWDVRKMKANSPVADCPHSRIVCGLEFSPVTGNSLISTCMDDHLRFISCDLSSLKVTCTIRHNNQTGRWLTNFKARFVPGRDDLVVVGSMIHPRRIEVWDTEGGLQHKFLGEHLGSVTSVVAFHPGRPILAGANSSGKVYVFK